MANEEDIKKKKKSRTFALELYPEDVSHMGVLDYIKTYFEYAYILHDKDVYTDTTDKHKIGELKKPHYHVVIYFKNPRYLQAIKDLFDLKHVETCNFYAYIRYLIHLDNPEKYQYNRDEIITNIETRVNNALNRDFNSKEQDSRILLNFINSRNFTTFRDLVDFAMENDCLLELQKRTYFYNLLCDNYKL